MNEAALRDAYEERIPFLGAFGDMAVEHIVTGLRQSGKEPDEFFQIPPKVRVKATDSFLQKALIRKKRQNPLEEITDQVGTRFVVLLLEDIATVGRLVEAGPWRWQKDRDHEAERIERPDYFAYQSDHYVVRLEEPVERAGLVIPAGTTCEIQIRTILQHAYAQMAHGCDYKPSIKLPEEGQRQVRRALAKGSALIETTDDVFREIVRRIEEYGQSIDGMLTESARIYERLTGESANPRTPLALTVADAYREKVAAGSISELQAWAASRNDLGPIFSSRRNESVFYRDSVVVLLGWLISKHRATLPGKWPVDSKYLENLYLAMGVSTNGLF